jgi:hypothetical protein
MHTSLSLHFIDVQCVDMFPILRRHYKEVEFPETCRDIEDK